MTSLIDAAVMESGCRRLDQSEATGLGPPPRLRTLMSTLPKLGVPSQGPFNSIGKGSFRISRPLEGYDSVELFFTPQVWSDRSRLQCNNAIHSSTVGALRGQLSPRFSKNIPSASAGHFCLQSLHHFATADAATCSAVATVLKGFASLTTRPGVRKMAIPFPLQLSMPTTFPRVVSLCGFHCSIRWGGSPKVG